MASQIQELEKQLLTFFWTGKYLTYMKLRKEGMKKKAKVALQEFFEDFKQQNIRDRRNFIDIVCRMAFITDDFSIYLPTNLYRNIFLPEISNWIIEEPYNPIPYKWSDSSKDNWKSIELDPYDQIALEKFANQLIGRISMNQHELEHGFAYDGDVDSDIHSIDAFKRFLGNMTNLEKRQSIFEKLFDLQRTAIDYKISKNEPIK